MLWCESTSCSSNCFTHNQFCPEAFEKRNRNLLNWQSCWPSTVLSNQAHSNNGYLRASLWCKVLCVGAQVWRSNGPNPLFWWHLAVSSFGKHTRKAYECHLHTYTWGHFRKTSPLKIQFSKIYKLESLYLVFRRILPSCLKKKPTNHLLHVNGDWISHIWIGGLLFFPGTCLILNTQSLSRYTIKSWLSFWELYTTYYTVAISGLLIFVTQLFSGQTAHLLHLPINWFWCLRYVSSFKN